MNPEQVEHELNNRKSAEVMVVRPGFGTQSDSWVGILTVTHCGFPMIFQVQSERGATIFRSDDVASVNEIRVAGGKLQFIIRLKGPSDYIGKVANVTA